MEIVEKDLREVHRGDLREVLREVLLLPFDFTFFLPETILLKILDHLEQWEKSTKVKSRSALRFLLRYYLWKRKRKRKWKSTSFLLFWYFFIYHFEISFGTFAEV